MDILSLIAIIILIAAIAVLVYYYVENTNGANFNIKDYFPSSVSQLKEGDEYSPKLDPEGDGKVSMGDKIKYTFKDIDMSSLNTEAFSKRLDTFLDEKSEELIESWSLATKNDLESLEDRCTSACESIDDLEKRFSEYSNVTDEKIEDLDKRLKSIEKIEEELDE